MSGYKGRRHQRRPKENPNFEPNWDTRVDDFGQMELHADLVYGVYAYGWKHPSEIQSLAIKPICDGRNVIAQAQSGAGKTGAFGIGILNRIKVGENSTQAIIMAPTRELATQIHEVLQEIGKFMTAKGLKIALFRGGHSVKENQDVASSLPHVVVGTPGRLVDLIESGHLRMEAIRMLCLDEADQMLKEDFQEEVQTVFRYLNQPCQLLLFSATIPLNSFNIMDQFMSDVVRILVKAKGITLEGITQFYVNVGEAAAKPETLVDIFGRLPIQKCVIFANHKDVVDYLKDLMETRGFACSGIHSNMSQSDRDKIMQQFRVGATRVLISTDLIARVNDIGQVTLVINFDLPNNRECYINRIGRSAMSGRKGVAINICEKAELRTLREIERHYATKINELPYDIDRIVKEINQDSESRDEAK